MTQPANRTIRVKFDGDPRGIVNASATATKSVGEFGRGAQRTADAAERATKRTAVPQSTILSWDRLAKAAAGAWAATKAFDQLKQAADAAAGLGAAQATVNQIFGDGARIVQDFGKRAADTLGQSNQDALQAAATFGTFAKSAGLAGVEAATFSTGLITLASDLAAFRDTTPQQAIEAIGAALRGESEPIRAYGVLLDEATLRQRAFALGLIATTTTALTPQQRVLAAQAEIYAQTADAQGAFSRESEGLAAQQAIANARWRDAQAALGQALLPTAIKVTGVLADMAKFVQENHEWLVPTVGVLAGVAGIFLAIAAAVKVWTVAQIALNIAMSLNPIGLIILAIAAVIAGIALIVIGIKKLGVDWGAVWENIRNAFGAAWDWVQEKLGAGWAFITSLPDRAKQAFKAVAGFIANPFIAGINWVIRKYNELATRFNNLPAILRAGFTAPIFPEVPQIRDMGGPVQAGEPYWIGLNRKPELFVPSQSGHVLTRDQAAAAVAGGGGHTEIRVYIGERELTEIVRVERVEAGQDTARRVRAARPALGGVR